LEKVVGTRMAGGNPCRLNPSDITDFTAVAPGSSLPAPVARRVAEILKTAGPGCRVADLGMANALLQEARVLALQEEGEIAQRLSGLRSAQRALAQSPRRKTIVLLSAGIISADGSGGRPDIGLDLGTVVGQDA